jgi:pimeloyl-ACP methyl ester carboxylesterase
MTTVDAHRRGQPGPTPLQWGPNHPARGRIVLLHGMTSQAATWWRVGPALAARGWQVVALDLPGHGRMPRLARPLDLDTLVESVSDRLQGPVDLLIGHSLGAIIALALASWRPAAARALVLEEPPGPCGADPAALADDLTADAELVHADRDRLMRRERQANPRWAVEDIEYAVDGIAAADAAAIVAGLHGPLRWDPAALLRSSGSPSSCSRRRMRPRPASAPTGGRRCVVLTARRSGRCCPPTTSSSSMGVTACTVTSQSGGCGP